MVVIFYTDKSPKQRHKKKRRQTSVLWRTGDATGDEKSGVRQPVDDGHFWRENLNGLIGLEQYLFSQIPNSMSSISSFSDLQLLEVSKSIDFSSLLSDQPALLSLLWLHEHDPLVNSATISFLFIPISRFLFINFFKIDPNKPKPIWVFFNLGRFFCFFWILIADSNSNEEVEAGICRNTFLTGLFVDAGKLIGDNLSELPPSDFLRIDVKKHACLHNSVLVLLGEEIDFCFLTVCNEYLEGFLLSWQRLSAM